MKLLKMIGIRTTWIVLYLFLGMVFAVPAVVNQAEQSPLAKAVFTVGIAGEAYAATPDYIVDGTDDHVQVQLAVDTLPATGGKVILFGGNYDFGATVTRAINNITIEGSGKSTYLANDGGTALISAAAQTGWLFKDIRTDAGGITAADDTIFIRCYEGTSLVDSSILSGATMPSAPVLGQQFYQNTTGRNIVYTYNGTAWHPDRAYGTIILYVDPAGTDDLNHGTATGASAVQTINYAYDMLPDDLPEPATINLSADTFVENLLWGAKAGKVLVQGAAYTTTPLVATGGTKGAGATPAAITGAFVAGANDGKLVEFTSGANDGLKRIVGETTAGSLYLVGNTLAAQPQNLDTYDILTWTSTINGYIDIRTDGTGGQTPTGKHGVFEFKDVVIDFVAAPAASIYNAGQTLYLDYVSIIDNGDNVYGFYADINAYSAILYSNMELGANTQAVESDIQSTVEVICSRIDGNEAAGTTGVLAHDQSSAVVWSSDIVHCNVGVYSWGDGDLWFVAPSVVNFVHGIVSYGARATSHSAIHYSGAAYVTFGTNMAGGAHATGGQSADAASYSYLGTTD